MTDQRQPKFAVGDLVRHRASGGRGVVTEIGVVCYSAGPGVPIVEKFTGRYTLSLGLDAEQARMGIPATDRRVTVDEILLERVDDEREKETP